MAKRATMSTEPDVSFDHAAAADAITEAIRLKREASELTGEHGAYVKGAVERLGVDKAAFGFARRLHEMDENKRASVLRSLLMLSDALGHFAQVDAFGGGPVDVMRDIVHRHDNVAPAAD